MERYATKSTSSNINHNGIYSGLVDPNWDEGLFSQYNKCEGIDIPIIAENRFVAAWKREVNDKIEFDFVETSQKLWVVNGPSKTGRSTGFAILTLIPTKQYAENNPGDISNKFVHYGDKNNFSGIAIYSDLNGFQLCVEKYINGNLAKQIHLSSENSAKSELALQKANAILKEIKLFRIKSDTRRVSEMTKAAPVEESYCLSCRDYHSLDAERLAMCEDFATITPEEKHEPWEDWLQGGGSGGDGGGIPDTGGDVDGGGGGGSTGGGNPPTVDPPVTPPVEPPVPPTNPNLDSLAYYKDLGEQGIDKMITDLESRQVTISKIIKTSTGFAALNGFSVGVNVNGMIISSINFLKNADPVALAFGTKVSVLGVAISGFQTYIGFTDGDISNTDIVSLVSTVLSGAGLACAFLPVSIPVIGVLGVTGCVVGVVSSIMPNNAPMLLAVTLENGSSVYIYIPGSTNVA